MATKKTVETPVETPTQPDQLTVLADAFTKALERTKPFALKTAATRKPASPFDTKDGSKKPKLTRVMYQHGLKIDPENVDVECIHLLNKLKVGRYLNNWVNVYKRKDQGIDIDYPLKTSAHKMKLAQLGITEVQDEFGNTLKTGFQVFLERMIAEGNKPKATPVPDSD